MSSPGLPASWQVDPEHQGQRLDAYLVARLPDHSRAALQRTIAAGHVLVSGKLRKASFRLSAGETVSLQQIEGAAPGPAPEAIDLSVLYEDDDFIAVDKTPGMVVHPAKGHWQGTLAAALAHRFETLSGVAGPARPGIVHRLDRDTSGVIVVAKHDRAHERLAAQFKDRTVEKEYVAIALGRLDRDADVIDRPIGPHPHSREKMAIREHHPESRPAVTRYAVIERFARYVVLRLTPKTGRTHQIRVHLASIGAPVLCDKLYGGRDHISRGELWPEGPGDPAEVVLARQALHARRLCIDQPTTGERLQIEAPIPADIAETICCLRR